MKYKLVIIPEAEEDLSDAFEWYENKRKGLGHDFLLQMDAGLRLIERNPRLFAKQYKGVRSYLIKRFPYKVFYRIESDYINEIDKSSSKIMKQ